MAPRTTIYGNETINTEHSIEIARGNIENATPFNAYGRLTTSGVVTNNIIWANGEWFAPPAIGAQLSIKSTSVEDGVGGTGIRSVELHYLDANLERQEETVVLNGITPVLTVATNIRFLQCSHLETYGTTKAAVGTITYEDAVTADLYNQIDATATRCSSSVRMVPKDKRLIVVGLLGSSVSGTAAAGAILSLATSHFQGHDYIEDSLLIPLASVGLQDGSETYNLPIPAVFNEGVAVGMLCDTDKAATITGGWFGWIEEV